VLSLVELREVWAACDDGSDYSRIVRLLILSGARKNEIGGLTWAEVGDDRLTISASRMKGARPHSIPLCPISAACLPRARPGYPHLFGRRRDSGFGGWSKGKAALPALASPWVLHDCRRSFATHAVELGLGDPDLVELCLGHVRPGVAGVYQRALRWPARVGLAEAWARVVSAAETPPGPGDR
jgi:integrase